MRPIHLLISAVQFLFVLALVAVGGLLLCVAHSPKLQLDLAEYAPTVFTYAGAACLFIGLGLLWGLYALNRGSYYQLQMGAHLAEIEPAIMREYLKTFWLEHFPSQSVDCDVIIHPHQKLEIIAEIPRLTLEQHQAFSDEVEKKLAHLLKRKLGYKGDFLFTVLMK